MSTLQDLVDVIQNDYLNRTDLQASVVRAIQTAVRHYERQRWPWNETSTALACVASSATIAQPSDFVSLDLLEITFSAANYELLKRSYKEIRSMNAVTGNNSLPVYYARRAGNFELSPIPDSAYAVTCFYTQKLPELTSNAMTTSNGWTNNAFNLIAYHATKLMWANVLRNDSEAQKYAQLERDALIDLGGMREEQDADAPLKPTGF